MECSQANMVHLLPDDKTYLTASIPPLAKGHNTFVHVSEAASGSADNSHGCHNLNVSLSSTEM